MTSRAFVRFALLLVSVLAAACGQRSTGPSPTASGTALSSGASPFAATAPAPVAPSSNAAPVQVVVASDGTPLSFGPLVKRSDPSVATIKARLVRDTARGKRTVGQGLGTGFVYDANGFLLTNHHVIARASISADN